MDRNTRDKLVEENYGYAIRISNQYTNLVSDESDRCSLAAEGLLRAVETHDPSRGAALRSHITNCVRRKMLAENKLAHRAKRRPPMMYSLDQEIMPKRGYSDLTFYDVIPSQEKNTLDRIVLEEDIQSLKGAINKLPPVLQEIISARYISEHPETQSEFAKRHRRTQAWAARQEKIALSKCREALC